MRSLERKVKEMTMFADARADDFYNQDFLDKNNRQFVEGYDYAVEQIKSLFEGNIDVYEDDLNSDLVDAIEEDGEKIIDMIEQWAESSRDELITSMIDSMDEKQYTRLRKKALKENKGKKEYYDTKHYVCTGEKIFREE